MNGWIPKPIPPHKPELVNASSTLNEVATRKEPLVFAREHEPGLLAGRGCGLPLVMLVLGLVCVLVVLR